MPYHGRTFECDSSFSELHLSHHRYRVLSYYMHGLKHFVQSST